MNFSRSKPQAQKLNFDKNNFSVQFVDGRVLIVPLAYFPRLLKATAKQLKKYEISGGGAGIHWDELNEDISVEGLLLGCGDQTQNAKQVPKKTA